MVVKRQIGLNSARKLSPENDRSVATNKLGKFVLGNELSSKIKLAC